MKGVRGGGEETGPKMTVASDNDKDEDKWKEGRRCQGRDRFCDV